MQDILQKARIQSKAKTQEEIDKYSDSDEDWDPEEEKEKTLKEKIDERMRKKSGDGMPLSEIKLSECAETDSSNQSSVINEVNATIDDDDDELPDIGDSMEKSGKDLNKLNHNVLSLQNEKESEEQSTNEKSADTDLAHDIHDSIVKNGKECDLESVQNELVPQCSNDNDNVTGNSDTVQQTKDMPDDLLYDWEKDADSENKDSESGKKCSETCGNNDKNTDENKENIDPNVQQSDKSNSEQILTPSRKSKSSPRSSTKKKKSKIAALAGIDLDNVKPCLSGNTDTFVTLEDSVDAPKNPGVQKLMDRLTKHSTKPEKKHKKDTDIR